MYCIIEKKTTHKKYGGSNNKRNTAREDSNEAS